jgi:hypothetical protein
MVMIDLECYILYLSMLSLTTIALTCFSYVSMYIVSIYGNDALHYKYVGSPTIMVMVNPYPMVLLQLSVMVSNR